VLDLCSAFFEYKAFVATAERWMFLVETNDGTFDCQADATPTVRRAAAANLKFILKESLGLKKLWERFGRN